MHMPGFTAEAVFYSSKKGYWAAAVIEQARRLVYPAQFISDPDGRNGWYPDNRDGWYPYPPRRCFSFCYCSPGCRRVCEIICI